MNPTGTTAQPSTSRILFGLSGFAVALGLAAYLIGAALHPPAVVQMALGEGGAWSFFEYQDADAQMAKEPVPRFIVLHRGEIDGGGTNGASTTTDGGQNLSWSFREGKLIEGDRVFDLSKSNVFLVDRAGKLRDLARKLSEPELRLLREEISAGRIPTWLDQAWDNFWETLPK